jgi:pimeloyl-ACP methyl ester carboxylesterase
LSEVEKIVSNPSYESLEPVEAWTRVDGLNVRYWRAGSGSPLILLHGLLGYSFSWRHAIPMLARTRTVFAPDMPGAGLSECDAALDCRLLSAAKRVVGFLDSLGIGDCDLVGSSYGGTTAMAVAGVAPGRVRSLILISPANPWSRMGRKRLRLLRVPVVASIFPKLARPMRGLNSYFVRRMYGDPHKINRETLEGYARPLAMPGRFEHAVKIVRCWNEDMKGLEAMLPSISDIPALILWGSRDRVVDPATAEQLRHCFKNVQTAVISGAGHLPYEECPDEFCRIVNQFLCRFSAENQAGWCS